jgi:cytochrome P450
MMTLGRPLGFLDGKDAFSLIKATSVFSWYIGLASHMPWLHKVLQDNFIMRQFGPPPVVGFAEKVVHERLTEEAKGNSPKRRDFLSNFLETHRRDPLMDENQVVISVVGNLLAGSLSPSSAMKELTRYLATHPESQKRLYEELCEHQVTSPASFSGVKDLPYLEGVIREALRLHPQIVVRLERVAPSGGMTLPDGTYLPAGTKVGALSHAMTMNRDAFGQDADEYVPERWMQRADESVEAHAERRNRMERTDMTFGQGSRSCIGKNVAILELFKATASLVLSFEFAQVPRAVASTGSHVKVTKRAGAVGHATST